MPQLELIDVALGYDAAAGPLVEGLTVRFAVGWTGVVGPNGAGKSTMLRVALGLLPPAGGEVVRRGRVGCCSQRTDEPPAGLEDLLADSAAPARKLVARLGVRWDWPHRWQTLSHGERRRAQLAVALRAEPEILALDEPTNHIDAATREMVLGVLRDFTGIGLLVSHDRALLDGLCQQCVHFDPALGVVLRRGGYTDGAAQLEQEHDSALRAREQVKREQRKLSAAASDHRRESSRADARRSRRGMDRKDHDARDRRNAAIVSGKDGAAGRRLDQLQGRMRQTAARLDDLHVQQRRELGLSMRGVAARCDALLRLPPGTLPVGDGALELPELVVRPDDRIGITGPNGAGKSTLVAHLIDNLTIPAERVVVMPQEVTAAESHAVLEALQALPTDRRGEVLAAVACLGSEPSRLLESEQISPGEVRKLLLALGLERAPNLIVMDEPTNHMDLPSIECLQRALSACTCALVLVSHDERFLKGLVGVRWAFADGALRVQKNPAQPSPQ